MDHLFVVVVETCRLLPEPTGMRALPASRHRVLSSWEWSRPEASGAMLAAEAEAWADELDQLRTILGPDVDRCWDAAWATVTASITADEPVVEDDVWPLAVSLAYSLASELGHVVDQLMVTARLAPVALTI
jgi:hypothetical protein